MQRLLVIIGLQFYAIALVLLRSAAGVKTDEAKYLLDIPYPHPPLARWIMSQTDWMTHQEIVWRIIFASLMVHAVWLIWDIGKSMSRNERFAICSMWLLSASVIFQAGSIMMAPLTALQGLFFVWLLQQESLIKKYPTVVPIAWIFSLFTAYQAVLFAPLVWSVMKKLKVSDTHKFLLFAVPVTLLVLYTLINPLALASMMNHSNRGISDSITVRFIASLRLWMIGGSIVLSLLGTIGMIRSKRWDLIGSFALVFLYIVLSRYDYYAILFTPLFVAGVRSVPKVQATIMVHIFVTALLCALYPIDFTMSTARTVMQEVNQHGGTVLIHGSFGHEWQYESDIHLKRYSEVLLPDASTVVCLVDCDFDSVDWIITSVSGTEVWIRNELQQ